MFERNQVIEMTKQFEELDTITADMQSMGHYYENYTTTDGMIYLLMSGGEVKCFDPFGKKLLHAFTYALI